jgi:protein-tyrosine-phosphatase
MTTPRVLFVCLHGSAKSLIALEHFRHLAQQRGVDVQADWAGIEPDAEIPPRLSRDCSVRASTCADGGPDR